METNNEIYLDLLMRTIEISIDNLKELRNRYLLDKAKETLTLDKLGKFNQNLSEGMRKTHTMLEETKTQLGHLLPTKYLARINVYDLELCEIECWRIGIQNEMYLQMILCGIKELEKAL